jgi:hypothetical protein
MTQDSSSTNALGGNQGAPKINANNGAIKLYIMRSDAHMKTRSHDYGMSESTDKGKEASNPPPSLHIENTMGETMTCIHKVVFKNDSYNLNTRVSQK